MKNFYEILEINENASQEIVEKAYKVLVKKYHPDLQTDPSKKQECEVKIKEINEAYETLSNSNLRTQYDNELKQAQYESTQVQNANHHEENTVQENSQSQDRARSIYDYQRQAEQSRQAKEEAERQYQEQYQNAINKAYHDAYVKRLKDMGYRIKYKKTPKEYMQTILIVVITIAVIILICQLPFVKDFFKHLYEENDLIRSIVDSIGNLFSKK